MQPGQQYTTQNLDYGTQTTGQGGQDDMTPDGCAFTVTGWREQNGTLFLKMVDKWDILANKGKYGPQSELWTPFLQHEFDYDPSQYELTGEFWVPMSEVSSLFYSFEVCRITSWDSLSIKGQFIRRTKKDNYGG